MMRRLGEYLRAFTLASTVGDADAHAHKPLCM
jgi:hypothetical protein